MYLPGLRLERGTIEAVRATTARNTWLAELATNGCASGTCANYRRLTDEAFGAIAAQRRSSTAKLELAAITRDNVIGALDAYRTRADRRSGRNVPRAPSTTSTYYTALRAFFSWCVATEKLARNPMLNIKRPKTPARIPKALSQQECGRLLAATSTSSSAERDRLAVLFGLLAGLRLAEMVGLTVDSFAPDIAAPTHVRVLGKGNKERVVPLPEAVSVALATYLPWRQARIGVGPDHRMLLVTAKGPGRPLTRDGLGQMFDRTLGAADLKVPGRRAHASRHSFATHVLSGGADILTVSDLLGHASVATTQIYLKVDAERLVGAVRANPLTQLAGAGGPRR